MFWIASIAGAALVVAFAIRQGGGALSTGDLLLFGAVAASSIGYGFSGRLTAEMPGWEVISWVLVIALPISLPAVALTMPADLTQVGLKPWLALLYVAVFSQWIGFFAWNAGMAMGGIARVAQVQLLQPFITFALAAIFNGENHYPANPAVRRGRGRNRRDQHAHKDSGCACYLPFLRLHRAGRERTPPTKRGIRVPRSIDPPDRPPSLRRPGSPRRRDLGEFHRCRSNSPR